MRLWRAIDDFFDYLKADVFRYIHISIIGGYLIFKIASSQHIHLYLFVEAASNHHRHHPDTMRNGMPHMARLNKKFLVLGLT